MVMVVIMIIGRTSHSVKEGGFQGIFYFLERMFQIQKRSAVINRLRYWASYPGKNPTRGKQCRYLIAWNKDLLSGIMERETWSWE